MRLFKRKKKLEFTLDDLKSPDLMLSAKVPDGFAEVEKYWLIPSFSATQILTDGENYFYALLEPELTENEKEILKDLKIRVIERLPLHSNEDEKTAFFNAFKEVIDRLDIDDLKTVTKLWYYLENECFHLGVITPLMKDQAIEDISISGYDHPVYVYHSVYGSMPTNITFDKDELDGLVLAIAQKKGVELSVARPIADTTLPDGSRINLTFRDEVTHHGSTFSIRKVRKIPICPVDLLRWNTFSPEEMALLWLCVESNSSILFIGGTAAGKTTSLNAVSLFIPLHSKIVSIEDTREIQLPHKNWISGVSRGDIDMFELMKASLRQRPEYIIVGEVRGREAEIMFQAMALGHTCLSTIHGGAVDSVLDRLMSPPYNIPRVMVGNLDLVVVLGRYRIEDRIVRRCNGIWSVILASDGIETAPVFKWSMHGDTHRPMEMAQITQILSERTGMSSMDIRREIEKRAKLLRSMVEQGFNYEMFLERVHGRKEAREESLKIKSRNGMWFAPEEDTTEEEPDIKESLEPDLNGEEESLASEVENSSQEGDAEAQELADNEEKDLSFVEELLEEVEETEVPPSDNDEKPASGEG